MEAFQKWIINNAEVASFSRWLLVEEQTGLDLDGEPEPLTFHQTLAQKYKGVWFAEHAGSPCKHVCLEYVILESAKTQMFNANCITSDFSTHSE